MHGSVSGIRTSSIKGDMMQTARGITANDFNMGHMVLSAAQLEIHQLRQMVADKDQQILNFQAELAALKKESTDENPASDGSGGREHGNVDADAPGVKFPGC